MPDRLERVSVSIDRRRFEAWTEIEIIRSLDSFATIAFSAPFEPERTEFRETFRPFSFRPLDVEIDDAPLFAGTMVDVTPSIEPGSRAIKASGYSLPAVLGDVSMPASAFPLEFSGLTLRQIAERVCEPFGLEVAFGASAAPDTSGAEAAEESRQRRLRRDLADLRRLRTLVATRQNEAELAQVDARIRSTQAQISARPRPVASPPPEGAAFRRVAMKPEDKPYSFLAGLARQRGLVVSSTANGALLFLQSTRPGRPVAVLREGEAPLVSVTPSFSPQGYFSEITGLAKTRSGRRGSSYTARNDFLSGVTRPMSFTLGDTDPPDLPTATDAKLGRMFGNMVSYQIELPTWRDPRGELWQPNTTIALTAPGAMIYEETELLVREARLKQTPGETSAALTLVLPGAFSGEIPARLPWD